MTTQLETRLEELKKELTGHLKSAADASEAARKESRPFTEDERKKAYEEVEFAKKARVEIDELVADLDVERQIKALGNLGTLPFDQPNPNPAPSTFNAGAVAGGKTVGQMFVESAQYKSIANPAGRAGSWTSGPVEVKGYNPLLPPMVGFKDTLTEGEGTGGAALIVPDYRPGILPILFRRLVVADLIAPGTTGSNLVRYMKETLATNAAAATEEGGEKPESALEFALVDEPVKKVATFLPVSDEMLEDYEQIRSYLDNRLGLFVQIEEEDQLLAGSGSGANVLGLLNRSGMQDDQDQDTDNIADAVFKQVMNIFTNSFLMPDGIIFNPSDWQAARLEKDSNGQYYGGGPFSGAYGQGPGGTVRWEPYWGLPVVTTPAMPAKTVFIGAFAQASQIFRRSGLVIEASNSHADFFRKDLTAIRALERLALAVYRPQSFGKVTLN